MIRKGDTVKIIAGKNRGKEGKVISVFPARKKIAVEGVNVYKKHMRPKREGEKGEVVDITRPFHTSNAMIVCSGCSKPTRVGHKTEGDKKVRACKKCNAVM